MTIDQFKPPSIEEIKARMAQLEEIVKLDGKSPRANQARFELAGLRDELAFAKESEGASENPNKDEDNPTIEIPVFSDEERTELEAQQPVTEVIAEQMAVLLEESAQSPQIMAVVRELRDERQMQDFLNADEASLQREIDFMTRGMKGDIQAKETVVDSLMKIYRAAQGQRRTPGRSAGTTGQRRFGT